MSEQNAIQKLIRQKIGDRSQSQLSRDCGGVPAVRTINELLLQPRKSFPDAGTMEGLARGLGVPLSSVVLAFASSIGMRVDGDPGTDLVLPGAGTLPPQSQENLLRMSRDLQNAYAQDWDLAAHKGEPGVAP